MDVVADAPYTSSSHNIATGAHFDLAISQPASQSAPSGLETAPVNVRPLPPLHAPCPSLQELKSLFSERVLAAEAQVTLLRNGFVSSDQASAQRVHDLAAYLAVLPAPDATSWTKFRYTLACYRLDLLLGAAAPIPPVEPVPGTDLSALTPIQAASVTNWTIRSTALDGATTSQLRKSAMAHLSDFGSHDTALPPPDANDPADMLRTAPPAMVPCRRSDLPPFIGMERPGERPVVDATQILALAAEDGCPRCAADLPCYHAALASNVDQHRLPWKQLPAHPNQTSPVYQFDADTWTAIDGHVQKAVSTGAIEKLSDAMDVPPSVDQAFTLSNVFLVRTYDLNLSAAQQDACNSAGSVADLVSVALQLTAAFMLLYAAKAKTLMSQFATNHAGLAQALAALWDATLSTLHMEKKSRLVINLRSHVNKRLHSWPFRYASISTFLTAIRPGGWLAKTDISAGFHHIRIAPGDLKYLAFKTPTGFYRFTRLPFGLSTAPALFSWLTAEVNAILRRRGIAASMVYIDDFVVYGDAQLDCARALSLLKEVCSRLNIKLDPDKTEGPVQRLTILGFVIDTSTMMLSLPPAKLLKTLFYLTTLQACAQAAVPVPVGPLRKAAGSFVRLGMVNPDARPHLRGFSLTQDGQHWAAPASSIVHISERPVLRDNLTWLSEAATAGRLEGEALLAPPHTRPWNLLLVTSDASLSGSEGNRSAGAGVRCGPALLSLLLPPDYAQHSIAVLELLPIAVFMLLAGDLLQGAFVIAATDNLGDAYSINSGRARSQHAAVLIDLIYTLRRWFKCDLIATWITRAINYLSDRLAACRTPADVAGLSAWAEPVPAQQLAWGNLVAFTKAGGPAASWEPDENGDTTAE